MRLRECEQSCRELNAVLQKIHTSGGIEKIPQLIKEIRGIFERSVRPQVAALFEAVPGGQPSQYYRYHHVFNFTLQRLVFFAAMAHYLEKEEILLKVRIPNPTSMQSVRDSRRAYPFNYVPIQAPAAKEWLGIEPEADNQNGKPHLDLEDYLNGLIQMSNELVRHDLLLALFLSMTTTSKIVPYVALTFSRDRATCRSHPFERPCVPRPASR